MFELIKPILALLILLWVVHVLLLVANLADNPVVKAVGRVIKKGFWTAIWLSGLLLELIGAGLSLLGSIIRRALE